MGTAKKPNCLCLFRPDMPLTPLQSEILEGAVSEIRRHAALTPDEIRSGQDRHQNAKLRSANRLADENVVRLNVRDWASSNVSSGAGRVRACRALKRLEEWGYIEKLELYEGSGKTQFIRITPAGLAAAESLLTAEQSA